MKKWIISAFITSIIIGSLSFVVFYYDNDSVEGNVVRQQDEMNTADIDLVAVTNISLDINPSLQILLNKSNNVVSYHSYNIEGDMLLQGMNLFNIPFEKALEHIVEELGKYYDINSDNFQLLVTVAPIISANIDREEAELEDQTKTNQYDYFVKLINTTLQNKIASESIYIWEVSEPLSKMAHDKGMSVGKLMFQLQSIEDLKELENELSKKYQELLENNNVGKNTPTISSPEKPIQPNIEVSVPTIPSAPTVPQLSEIQPIKELPSIKIKE